MSARARERVGGGEPTHLRLVNLGLLSDLERSDVVAVDRDIRPFGVIVRILHLLKYPIPLPHSTTKKRKVSAKSMQEMIRSDVCVCVCASRFEYARACVRVRVCVC